MQITTNYLSKEWTLTQEEVLHDYKILCESRQISLLGRKEVFMGRAKFGIFGDGKELAQIAMAKVFRKGDFRSGYYRDQTFMFAIGETSYQQFFAQLYAHTSIEADPASAGRMMNAHFVTRSLNKEGLWNNLMEIKNSAADMSSTASQMPRLIGLGYASKLYRHNPQLWSYTQFSNKGNEIAFGTIGNGSTSEGIFLEAINAAGVLQIPILMSVWDDDYAISVPQEYHTTKCSISKALSGFQRTENEQGVEILVVKAWDYLGLIEAYQKAEQVCREEHIPVLIHVTEVTQQQGHSTSGSHERYKSKERLEWEKDYDCLKKMREWILQNGYGTEEDLLEIEKKAKNTATIAKNKAWRAFVNSMKKDHEAAFALLQETLDQTAEKQAVQALQEEFQKTIDPIKSDSIRIIKKLARAIRFENIQVKEKITLWIDRMLEKGEDDYSSHLYSESVESPLNVLEVKPVYDENSHIVDGREVLQACFDVMLENDPRVFAIGEDVGKIGDVNQAFAGLQAKHGELKVTDTGIREASIIGQGIGAAMRGLRPITEIQYLDYINYPLMTLMDDLACLQYRTKGGQKAPMMIRTRGHRLEGIWHSGSPMGMLLGSLRGIHLLVPRNMTQAAGMYNTWLRGDDPALMIESLNGYRLKEKLPANIGTFTVSYGVPEIIREGTDITVVTYGSMCRIVMEAANQLQQVGISLEIIDIQTLLPFDRFHSIVASIKKTNRAIFADEDMPGGASAYMMQQVVEGQDAYHYLDSKPLTISAKPHRPAYASDGDYFSKPNVEQVFETAYRMMRETEPIRFPILY
jgi:2-oxoisovalerate dehydrogenase E1 component